MKVLIGYTYAVTAKTDTTVTDTDGLSLSVKAGSQGYFVATVDTVTVTGNATIAQIRGNFNMPTTSGGGGGQMGYFVLTDAEQQTYKFYADLDNLEYITDDLPQGWFKGNAGMTEWNVPLPNLKSGYGMFEGCTGLTTWTIALSSLTDGTNMFKGCTGLTGAATQKMADKVTNGTSMFEGCTWLTGCAASLVNLEDGTNMFKGCTHFKEVGASINFAKLVTAPGMFSGCQLSMQAMLLLGNKIKTWTDGATHEITFGIDSGQITQAMQNSLNTGFNNKGWTVTWERN